MKKNNSIATLLYENHLFNLVREVGEISTGQMHIIDTTDKMNNEERFRVYHSAGYCFDIEKQYTGQGNNSMYEYFFYSEWAEFSPLKVRDAITLLEDYFREKV